MAKVGFAKPVKMKLFIAVLTLIIAVVGTYYIIFQFRSVFLGGLFLFALAGGYLLITKRLGVGAGCPHCKKELFNVIANAKMYRAELNYCPSCGGKIIHTIQ